MVPEQRFRTRRQLPVGPVDGSPWALLVTRDPAFAWKVREAFDGLLRIVRAPDLAGVDPILGRPGLVLVLVDLDLSQIALVRRLYGMRRLRGVAVETFVPEDEASVRATLNAGLMIGGREHVDRYLPSLVLRTTLIARRLHPPPPTLAARVPIVLPRWGRTPGLEVTQ